MNSASPITITVPYNAAAKYGFFNWTHWNTLATPEAGNCFNPTRIRVDVGATTYQGNVICGGTGLETDMASIETNCISRNTLETITWDSAANITTPDKLIGWWIIQNNPNGYTDTNTFDVRLEWLNTNKWGSKQDTKIV